MLHAKIPVVASLGERLIGTGARGAGRIAEAAGIDRAVEQAAEDAVVRALESAALERALIRVLESTATDDALDRALESPAVERALVTVLDSELVDRVWERLLASDEAQKLVERIAKAPEVRAALAAQSIGLLGDFGREVQRLTRRLDLAVENLARRLTRRTLRSEPPEDAGLISRGAALAIDGAFLSGAFVALSSLGALILTALVPGADKASTPLAAVGVGLWVLGGALYLISFWALAGQTPGMRFLGLRLDAQGRQRIGLRCARRRLFALVLALVPLGAGVLAMLFSDRRQGLQDTMAGTEVFYADRKPAPWSVAEVRPGRVTEG